MTAIDGHKALKRIMLQKRGGNWTILLRNLLRSGSTWKAYGEWHLGTVPKYWVGEGGESSSNQRNIFTAKKTNWWCNSPSQILNEWTWHREHLLVPKPYFVFVQRQKDLSWTYYIFIFCIFAFALFCIWTCMCVLALKAHMDFQIHRRGGELQSLTVLCIILFFTS